MNNSVGTNSVEPGATNVESADGRIADDSNADAVPMVYAERLMSLTKKLESLRQGNSKYSVWRGVTFVPALLVALFTFLGGMASTGGYLIAAVLFGGFLWLTQRHDRLRAELRSTEERIRINEHHVARVNRDLAKLPDPTPDVEGIDTAVAFDLDLFGENSIFQWLCLAYTPLGRERLANWLVTPATPDEISLRQDAVRRLAPDVEMREELQLRGRLLRKSRQGPNAFLEWAEQGSWLDDRPAVLWFARIAAVWMLLGIIGLYFGLFPVAIRIPIAVSLAIVTALNLILNVVHVPGIHRRFDSLASRNNEVDQYQSMFQMVNGLPDSCEKFVKLKQTMRTNGVSPVESLDDLSRRVNVAASRRSAFWGIPYLFGQLLLQLDIHVLQYLEGWQRKHGSHARRWFEGLAELESLSSLSAVAHDHPTWCYPTVKSDLTQLEGKQLGHPLIASDVRVSNDVSLGPKGRFLLVTGSNMSGKSTLLRSIGLNVILAQTGAPVCADECSLPELCVATSMRVRDSLSDGVSFYMAELQRLKEVVDQAAEMSKDANRTLIYLLDEILLGTNSAERHVAVVEVVRHLLDAGAIGAISTHDLELGNSEQLSDACDPVHFRERIEEVDGESQMTFDYQMRDGVATTTNALKLLEMVGLRSN